MTQISGSNLATAQSPMPSVWGKGGGGVARVGGTLARVKIPEKMMGHNAFRTSIPR